MQFHRPDHLTDGLLSASVAIPGGDLSPHRERSLVLSFPLGILLVALAVSVMSVAAAAATFDLAVSGPLTGSNSWHGQILVTGTVMVNGSASLRIEPGTVVSLTNAASLSANGGGHIDVAGSEAQPIFFQRSGTNFNLWGDLAAAGNGSILDIRHAVISRGRVRCNTNAVVLLEDSEVSDGTTSGMIGGSAGSSFTIRRCYVHDYQSVAINGTRTLAEDSLFERANSDIFELQGAPSGCLVQRCTFRECLQPNSDAVDMNGCHDVFLSSCLIYDVTDKGISSGSASSATDPTSVGLVVSNTVVYRAGIGIAFKDNATGSLYQNTFADVVEGIAAYGKFTATGGHVTNGYNNIVWARTNALRLTNGATISIETSDLVGTNLVGVGNISADPLWLDVSAGDFRLRPGSPCLGSGRNGTDMGATAFPVGAPMAPSHPQFTSIATVTGGVELTFWADSVRTYTVERTSELAPALNQWQTVTNLPTATKPRFVRFVDPADAVRFYRLRAN